MTLQTYFGANGGTRVLPSLRCLPAASRPPASPSAGPGPGPRLVAVLRLDHGPSSTSLSLPLTCTCSLSFFSLVHTLQQVGTVRGQGKCGQPRRPSDARLEAGSTHPSCRTGRVFGVPQTATAWRRSKAG